MWPPAALHLVLVTERISAATIPRRLSVSKLTVRACTAANALYCLRVLLHASWAGRPRGHAFVCHGHDPSTAAEAYPVATRSAAEMMSGTVIRPQG